MYAPTDLLTLLLCRITYWPQILTIAAAELEILAKPTGRGPVPAPATAVQPALEVGIDDRMQLCLLHEPALVQVEAEGSAPEPLVLSIEKHTADLEAALLQAAAASANIQLGEHLRCSFAYQRLRHASILALMDTTPVAAGLLKLLRTRGEVSGNNGSLKLQGLPTRTNAEDLLTVPVEPPIPSS